MCRCQTRLCTAVSAVRLGYGKSVVRLEYKNLSIIQTAMSILRLGNVKD